MRDNLDGEIEYKGYTITIEQDDDAQSPQDCGDDGAFLVAWHRDFYVEPPRKDLGSDPQRWVDYYQKTHWQYPIEAYIHSGVALARAGCGNFCDRRWDVSNPVGFIALSKKEWKTRDSKRAARYVDGLIETWNQYLSGDVWGYTVTKKDEDGNDLLMPDQEESCWGMYGRDYCLEDAKRVVDYLVKKESETCTTKLKTRGEPE